MLSLSEATRVLAAAEEKAISIGRPVNCCVVDEGGHLIAQIRMDGAWKGGAELACRKAYTACALEMQTKELVNLVRSGEECTGISGSNHERLLVATGGIPLRRNGRLMGAIGISGGMGNQDQSIAEAAARAYSNELGNGQHRDHLAQDYQPVAFGQKVLSRSVEERQ
jgi:uncharacterized protein GlcG (DUF336 family)